MPAERWNRRGYVTSVRLAMKPDSFICKISHAALPFHGLGDDICVSSAGLHGLLTKMCFVDMLKSPKIRLMISQRLCVKEVACYGPVTRALFWHFEMVPNKGQWPREAALARLAHAHARSAILAPLDIHTVPGAYTYRIYYKHALHGDLGTLVRNYAAR